MAASQERGDDAGPSTTTGTPRPTIAVWLCGGEHDVIATELAARLEGLGLTVAQSPGSADCAVVMLSPSLAAADPPELSAWLRDRGSDKVAFALNAGEAEWHEDAGGFTAESSAVPPSVRAGLVTTPLIVDLRDADADKIDRVAHLVAAAVTSEPTARPARRSRQRMPWAAGALVAAILTIVSSLIMGRGDEAYQSTSIPAATSTIPALTSTRPTSTVQATSTVRPTTTSVSPTSVPLTSSPQTVPATQPPPVMASEPAGGIVVAVLVAATLVLAGVGLWRLGRRAGMKGSHTNARMGSPAQAQVFVSHDMEADGRVAQRLVKRLQQHDLEAWTAQSNIYPGEQWIFAIERGLTSSRGALILLSQSALGSNWVKQEIQMIINLAVDGKIHVIPIRLDRVEVPLVLRGYQLVDVGDFDRAVSEFQRRFVRSPSP